MHNSTSILFLFYFKKNQFSIVNLILHWEQNISTSLKAIQQTPYFLRMYLPALSPASENRTNLACIDECKSVSVLLLSL